MTAKAIGGVMCQVACDERVVMGNGRLALLGTRQRLVELCFDMFVGFFDSFDSMKSVSVILVTLCIIQLNFDAKLQNCGQTKRLVPVLFSATKE